MRPLPDLENTEALILRGKRSLLASARNEAAEALRDACTMCQSAEWGHLSKHAQAAAAAAVRLSEIDALWGDLK